jgi:spore coat protein SA
LGFSALFKNSEFIAKGERHSVAVLLSSREQFSAYFGGALARWTYEVYARLNSRFHVTVFGYPTAIEDLYPLRHVTSSFWRLCNAVALFPIARRYEEKLWLRALFSELRTFEFVHIHNRPQWAKVLRDFGYRGKIILHLQNDHLGHWSIEMLDDLDSHLDAVVVCSEYLRSTFASKGSRLGAKTSVVFNGVNTKLFYPRENVREPKTICFVGRFHPEKGVLQLVQAYARTLQEHPDAKLVIAGATGFGTHEPTPYVREVTGLANSLQKLRPGSIHFAGYLHHDRDLPAMFQKATVFSTPSLFQEPFGLVNVEAMACGTPVVGSRRGGIPQVLGDSGVLVDPEDIPGFSDALSALLGDSERRARVGHGGYQRCMALFDWDRIAAEWTRLLDSLSNSLREESPTGTLH